MGLDDKVTVLDLYLGLEQIIDKCGGYEIETFDKITVNIKGCKKFKDILHIDNENKKVYLEQEPF